MVASIRTFFQASNEAEIVRKIAVQMSYLPAGVRVASDSDGGLTIANEHEFMAENYEGLLHAKSVDGFVRGTQIDFPRNGPKTKYAALFDKRGMFDNLREAFLVHAGIESKPTVFLASLEDVAGDVPFASLAASLRKWCGSRGSDARPESFGLRAWRAYLMAVGRECY